MTDSSHVGKVRAGLLLCSMLSSITALHSQAGITHGKNLSGPAGNVTLLTAALASARHNSHNESALVIQQSLPKGGNSSKPFYGKGFNTSSNYSQTDRSHPAPQIVDGHRKGGNKGGAAGGPSGSRQSGNFDSRSRRNADSVFAPKPNSVPLSTQNFTRMGDNCSGHYHLTENIRGHQLNQNEFPLCSQQAFSGSLHGNGHSIQDLNITKSTGTAALFGSIHGSTIQLTLDRPTISGTSAATIAGFTDSMNHVEVNIQNGGKIKQQPGASASRFGGISTRIQGDHNYLELQTDGRAPFSIEGAQITEPVLTYAGSVTGFLQGDNNTIKHINGHYNLDVPSNFFSVAYVAGTLGLGRGSNNIINQRNVTTTVNGEGWAGGLFASYTDGTNNIFIQENSTANVTGLRAGGMASQTTNSAGGNRYIQSHSNLYVKASTGGKSGGISQLAQPDVQQNSQLIQVATSTHVPGIKAGSAFGTSASNNFLIALFSGISGSDGQQAVCGLQIFGGHTDGWVDTAGYQGNTSTCNAEVQRLNTTQPQDWRFVHSVFCDNSSQCSRDGLSATCHLPHEQLLGVLRADNSSLLLASRQLYPCKPASNQAGLVRLSRVNITNGTELHYDYEFGINGTALLSPQAVNVPLPDTSPVSSLLDQQELVSLFSLPDTPATDVVSNSTTKAPQANKNVLLATFPLQDSEQFFDTTPVYNLQGEPVMLAPVNTTAQANTTALGNASNSYEIWTLNRDSEQESTGTESLRVYQQTTSASQPQPNLLKEYPLFSFTPDAPVIGLGHDRHWLYVARQENATIYLERFDLVSGDLNDITFELQDVPLDTMPGQGTELLYTLRPEGDRINFFPRASDGMTPARFNGTAGLSAELPEYGGHATWTYQDISSINVTAFQPPARITNYNNSGAVIRVITRTLTTTLINASIDIRDKLCGFEHASY